MDGTWKMLNKTYSPKKYKLAPPHTHRVANIQSTNNKCWQGHGASGTQTFLVEINFLETRLIVSQKVNAHWVRESALDL